MDQTRTMSSRELLLKELLLQVVMEVSVQFQAPQDQVKLKVNQEQEGVVLHPNFLDLLQEQVLQVLHQEQSTAHHPRFQQVVVVGQVILKLKLMEMLELNRKDKHNSHLQLVHSMEQQQSNQDRAAPLQVLQIAITLARELQLLLAVGKVVQLLWAQYLRVRIG